MTTMQPVSWREERRRDRMTDAQIGRENEAARTRLRRDERKQRGARRAERMAWLRVHVTGLLFMPVIMVPGVLAWTAMAAYGRQVFGPAGVTLPAFSEGAMWAFAGATTITRHRHPGRPVWHLRLGTAVFAAEGAALNFIHGVTPAAGQLRGLGAGVVMALISVAGVVAHQLITAGPRRSRSEREETAAVRASERRVRAVRRAALRGAVATLDADGNARMMFRPGVFTLTRSLGWRQLEVAEMFPQPGSDEPDEEGAAALAAYHGWRSAVIAPAAPDSQPQARYRPALALSAPPQKTPVLRQPGRTGTGPAAAPQTAGTGRLANASNSVSRRASKPAAGKTQKRALRPSEKRALAERLLAENPTLSTPDLVAQAGVSKATADRIRSQAPRRLRVAGG